MIWVQLQSSIERTHHAPESEERTWVKGLAIDAHLFPQTTEEGEMGGGKLFIQRNRSLRQRLASLEMSQTHRALRRPPSHVAFFLRLDAEFPCGPLSQHNGGEDTHQDTQREQAPPSLHDAAVLPRFVTLTNRPKPQVHEGARYLIP
jgi:hypothetical protein